LTAKTARKLETFQSNRVRGYEMFSGLAPRLMLAAE
jgi:hypothetical protein